MAPPSKWTAEQDAIIARMWLRDSESLDAITARLKDKLRSAIYRRITIKGWAGHKGDYALFALWEEGSPEPTIRPVTVAASSLPKPPKPPKDKDHYFSLHWSDVHFPFQDPRCVEIVYQVAQDIKPDKLFMMGDLLDFWQLSSYRPPKERRLSADELELQRTLELGAEHLAIMGSLCRVGGERTVLWGNHEDRLERFLGAARQDPKLQHLLSVKAISSAFDLRWLMGLEDLGWRTIDYMEDDTHVENDRLVIVHGDRVNKWATRTYLDKYGKSVIFGHDHRIQNFTRRDLRGTDSAWGIGCLCKLDPHYMSFPNWHNGFAVIEWIKDPKEGWLFNVSQIRIHDGTAVFRGKAYKG